MRRSRETKPQMQGVIMIKPEGADPAFSRKKGKLRFPNAGFDVGDDHELLHNALMRNHPTRPELDAKLETIEARMDGRLARIEDAVNRISEDNAATRSSISSLKTTTVVTAVGAVLTVLFGVAAFNATLLSNMTSSFDSGRETAKLAAEAQMKSAQTQEQAARLIADAEVKAAQTQKDTAAALAEIRAIVSDLNKKPQ